MNGAPPAPSASSQGFDVFLSYNSRDHVAVEGIANQLRAQNLKPFLDRWYLGPGLRWRPELEKTLASCKAVAVFFGPDGMGSWQQREVDVALDRQSQAPAFAVIPVLLPGCEPPLGFLRQNTWVDLRSQPEPALLILAKAIRGEPPGPDLQEQFAATRASLCPYRGLLYFREEDAPFFFGREKAIEGLAAAARQKRFLAVVGASGCGKSSVVRAGLVPQLRRDRDTTWEIATLVPGDQPLKALAAALLPFLEPAMTETDRLAEVGKLAGHFASGAISLRDVVQRVLARQPGTDRLLLVADQWEELYTLAPHAEARRRFIDELLDSSVRGPLTVVLTLRGDFVGSALAYRLLCDRLQDAQINLGPMTRAELEQAVTQPAARVGLAFKPGLAERILDDVGDEPGHLPLLEFVLRRLWEARHHGQLLHAAYERMGGLQGAVADKAERFYSTLSGPEQAAVQRLFLQLVRPGEAAEDTRRRERLDEIPESSRDLVKRLADERLLVTTKSAETGEETCEVAHEALIRHWRRFKEWLNADREFLLWRERLRAQLGEWEHADKSEETLLRGPILAEADRWLRDRADRLTPHEHDFITGSTEARERRRQEERDRQQRDLETERELRQTKEASARAAEKRAAEAETHSKKLNLALIAATVMMIVAMVAGRMSLKAKQLAEQSERKASLQLAEAGWLVAKGARGDAFAAREESPIKAAHYLLRAASAAAAAKDGPAVRNASLAAKVAGASLLRSLIHDGAVVGATNSPDRQRILTWSDDGTARLWNAADGKAVSAPMKHEGRVNGALYSPDGQRILTWSFDGTAWLWNATDGKAVGVPMKHEGIVWGADYSADGQRILSWSGDGTARLWNVADGTAMGQLMKHERVYGALYSPDGQRILTWSRSDGYGARCEGRLWSTTDGKAVGEPMTHQNDINGALYSPDGQRILTWSFDGTARLWNATDGKSVGEPMKHEGNVWRARYSADRQRILTWSNEARLWNATDGKSVGEPMKHEGHVWGALYSPDGQRILTWSSKEFEAGGEARLWNAANSKAVGEPMKHEGHVWGALYSADGRRILTWSDKARLWNAADGKSVGEPMKHQKDINGALYSPDGQRILTWSNDGTARLWSATDGKSVREPMNYEGRVNEALFSAGGQRILTWGDESTARLWNSTADGKSVGEPMKHEGSANGALFSPDDQRILTWSEDETARLWNASDGKAVGEPMLHQGSFPGPIFSPNGQRVLTLSGNGTARLWNVADGRPAGELMKHERVHGALYSPDGQHILTWSRSDDFGARGEGRLWSATDGKAAGEPMNSGVDGAFFSADGERILTWGGGTARLWNVADGRPVGELMKHERVDGALYSADRQRILTWAAIDLMEMPIGHERGEARLWNATDGKPVGEPMKHEKQVRGALYTVDGQRILTWSGNAYQGGGEARLWNAADGKAVGERMKHAGSVRGLLLSAGGQRILTWGDGGSARLWNASDGKAVGEPMKHQKAINGALYSADGQRILTWSEDETARLWNASDGKAVGEPMKHEQSVHGALCSADGQRILTWSNDGTARLWSTGNSQCIAVFKHDGPVTSARFNRDETRVLTASADGTVRLWDISLDNSISVEERILEFEVRSATTLGADGQVRVLRVAEWEVKQRELAELQKKRLGK